MYKQEKLSTGNASLRNICKERFVKEEIKRLSRNQRNAIQETFKLLYTEPLKNGHGIFVRLFVDFPEYKEIWPRFRGIPDSAIISDDGVKRHGLIYMNGLKTIIDNMDNEEKMAEMISKIAISHLKWNICKDHVMNMLPEVLAVLQSCQLQDKFVRDAWFTLYDIIGNLLNKFKAIQFEKDKIRHAPISCINKKT